jgi:hypothetical protein
MNLPFQSMLLSSQLLTYTDGTYTTNAGIFTATDKPEFIMFMIPGGNVPLGLYFDQTVQARDMKSFVWTWAPLWLQRHAVFVVVDMPIVFHDKNNMPAKFRHSESRAVTIQNLIEQSKQLYPGLDIICYGHSYGSIEASKVADVSKAIIGAGTWKKNPTVSINNMDGYIKEFAPVVPTMIVHHLADQTPSCHYPTVQPYMEQYPSILVKNGLPHTGNPAQDPGPHFWTTQESEVVKALHLWIRDKIYPQIIE